MREPRYFWRITEYRPFDIPGHRTLIVQYRKRPGLVWSWMVNERLVSYYLRSEKELEYLIAEAVLSIKEERPMKDVPHDWGKDPLVPMSKVYDWCRDYGNLIVDPEPVRKTHYCPGEPGILPHGDE